jgi:hypothetical protein
VPEREIARVGADSPAGVVLRLWRAVQVGDIPSAVGFYHPRVRRAFGFADIAGSLSDQQASISLLRPEVVAARPASLGTEVVLRLTSGGSGVGVQSFLVRRGSEGLRIGYDTLLGNALPSYVENEIRARVAPASDEPPRSAQAAARRVRATYRNLFARDLERARQHSRGGQRH